MEDESLALANGGGAAPNGHPTDNDQTLTLAQGDQEDGGSDAATIKTLQHEIQDLKTTRSDLHAKLQELEAQMEQSEVEKNAIASHASYLEGELYRTQQDLTSAAFVAEAAERDVQALRQFVRDLEEKNASLEASKAALEAQVRGLEERIAAYSVLEADLESEKGKAVAADSKREEEVSALETKRKDLEWQLKLSREDKVVVEAELKLNASREAELEKAVKELKERNAELEGKINGFVSKIDRDLVVDKEEEETEEDAAAKGFRVSWATAAGAVASTATVAATATVIYLRHTKQR